MAEPLIVQLTSEFRQALLEQEQGAVDVMVKRWLAIEDALEADILALVEQVSQAGQSVTESQLFRLRRMQELLAQTQEQISRFTRSAGNQLETLQAEAARQGLNNAMDLMEQAAGGEDVRLLLRLDRLNVEAAENIAALARGGRPLASLLERTYPTASAGMIEQLIRGVALGINPRETTRRILRDGLAQGLNHVLLVTRDQQIRAYREASRQQYQNSRMVVRYRRLAAKQPGRTCLACLALDGTVYEKNELMPLHPQDRCVMIPIIRGVDEIPLTTGEVYFKTLDAATQKDWLGPERYELWKDGQLDFQKLATIKENDTWGPSAEVTSLKNLRLGKGGATSRKLQYTRDYWRIKDDVARIEKEGEFFDGELQEAQAELFAEEQVSNWARRYSYEPGLMVESDWKRLADKLQKDAFSDLRLAREADRISAGNQAAGRKFVGPGSGIYMQLGGQTIEQQWVGGSRSQAARITADINQTTKEAAGRFMAEKLAEFGYNPTVAKTLNYEQQRRLLAEIGHGQLQSSNIGGVTKAERQAILDKTSKQQRRDAQSIVINPRAGQGLDKWFGYEIAMVKAGKADSIAGLPDFREDKLPDYVLFPGGKKKKVTKPIVKPQKDEFEF